MTIICGHHHHDSRNGLCNNPDPGYNWTREPLPVSLTVRVIRQGLSSTDITKNSKLRNTASTTGILCTSFLAVLCLVVVNAKNFNKAYEVRFDDVRVADIIRYLMPTKCIPQASITTYDRLILGGMRMGCKELLPIVSELDGRAPFTGNRTTAPIGFIHISHPQLLPLRQFSLPICEKGVRYDLVGNLY